MDFGAVARKWLGLDAPPNPKDDWRRKGAYERNAEALKRHQQDAAIAPTSPAQMFVQGLLAEEEPERKLPSVMAGYGTPAQEMARMSREAVESKQDAAYKSGRVLSIGLDALDLGAVMKAAALSGTLVNASKAQIDAAKSLLKKGHSKEDVWRAVKVLEAPNGEWMHTREEVVDLLTDDTLKPSL